MKHWSKFRENFTGKVKFASKNKVVAKMFEVLHFASLRQNSLFLRIVKGILGYLLAWGVDCFLLLEKHCIEPV